MKNLVPEHLGWRIKPGILGQHASSPQSVHALLGYFLKDRESPTPFPGRDRLAREGLFDWGLGPPLEKVIEGPQHLQHLLQVPELYRQSVAIIEPWPDVGTNPRGEQVRASKNIAYMLQQIADADTILYPVWRSGIENPGRLANVLSAGIATVVQGGNPSVHDARSFDGGQAGLEELLSLVDELLLRRSTGSGPSIFICLGTSSRPPRTSASCVALRSRCSVSPSCRWTHPAGRSPLCSACASASSTSANRCRSSSRARSSRPAGTIRASQSHVTRASRSARGD